MRDYKNLLKQQREYFHTGETRNVEFRIEKLKALAESIKKYEEELLEALWKDLRKPRFEGYMTEVGIVLDEIKFIIKRLRGWAKVKRVKTPIAHFLSSSYRYPEPYGVALIIAPWNYPFQLVVAPLLGAIAGGNCSIVKASPFVPETNKVIEKIIKDAFEEKYIAFVDPNEGKESVTALLELDFDYIFFTGSVPVGKVIMEAAAKHLIPLTLELGGKSPCIIHEDADIKLAAKRVAWGKFINAGQTCVAPDYVLAHKSIKAEFLAEVKKCIKEFYGDNPYESKEYLQIISENHFNRLSAFLKDGDIITGGGSDKDKLYIEPTVIDNVTWDFPVMGDEIFGPILPVLEYESLEEVVRTVNSRPKPLALYIFSTKKSNYEYVLQNTSSGGGCINDTITHVASAYLPFGGVGASGMGAYHGKASFDTFSHYKSIINKSNLIDVSLRYAPYGEKIKILKKIFK